MTTIPFQSHLLDKKLKLEGREHVLICVDVNVAVFCV